MKIALIIEEFLELSSKVSNTLILDLDYINQSKFFQKNKKGALASPQSKSGIIPITQPFLKS